MEILEQANEQKDEKYIKDLNEYFDAYIFSCINEIFVGIGIGLGLQPGEAYKLIKNRPGDLQKAEFFNKIFEKFKTLFGKYKIGKFRITLPNRSKHFTESQWKIINNSIEKYWKENAHKIAENMTAKGYTLGSLTNKYRQLQIPHVSKSLVQIAREENIPSSLKEVYDRALTSYKPQQNKYNKDRIKKFGSFYKNYDFENSQKKIINRSFSNIAMYLSNTENDIKESVRQQITSGINDNKSPVEIASDLYWNVQKSGNTAESVRRNWSRVSATEVNSVFEAGIMAPYEAEAVSSLLDDDRAVYFARIGGTCAWCRPLQGTIVRMIPAELVPGDNDSLKAMGIDDPVTDIAVWTGKNNIGRKQANWWICNPAHPWNAATFSPINPKKQKYSSDLGRVVNKTPESLKKYGIKEANLKRSEKEIEARKPKIIGENLVRYNDNVYQAFESHEMSRRMDDWRKNRDLPIPVPKGTPQYRRIFEAAA